MSLEQLGWNDQFEAAFESLSSPGQAPARVGQVHKQRYVVHDGTDEHDAVIAGRLHTTIRFREDYPVVGDWVVIQPPQIDGPAVIQSVLPRASAFTRVAPTSGGAKSRSEQAELQVLAANIDVCFLVSGLDLDFNPSKIERFVTLAWESGASPVVVLNKADLCENVPSAILAAESVSPGLPVLSVSAQTGDGVDELAGHVGPGQTAVFLGSSGVGKSSLINRLFGDDRLRVQEIRAQDGRGRHTTTHRELFLLPSGGLVIDTPGLREVRLSGDVETLEASFADVEALAASCRFSDCGHDSEPGCAVREAIKSGELTSSRYQGYLKQLRELAHLERRDNRKERRRAEKDFDKRIRQYMKERKKYDPKLREQ
jgi:ribosome biogenesis GTPase